MTRVELVDTTDGTNLWGDQFQHATTDVLALEERLVDAIAEQLRVRLTRDEQRRLRKRHTESAGAYEAYMRGRFQLAKRTSEGFTKAIECSSAPSRRTRATRWPTRARPTATRC